MQIIRIRALSEQGPKTDIPGQGDTAGGIIGGPAAADRHTMPASPEEPLDVERVLMDRARRLAERHDERPERPLLPRVVGLALAMLVVVIVLFAFDRFLASMQRFLGLPIADPEPVLTEPLPAYVVPADPGAQAVPPDGGQDEQPQTPPRDAAGKSGAG